MLGIDRTAGTAFLNRSVSRCGERLIGRIPGFFEIVPAFLRIVDVADVSDGLVRFNTFPKIN